MNLGDFAIAVMLILGLVVLVVGTIFFGVLGLALGMRRLIKAWW